ncbi:MAG: PA14 domain-containing protein, partial [bacterium]
MKWIEGALSSKGDGARLLPALPSTPAPEINPTIPAGDFAHPPPIRDEADQAVLNTGANEPLDLDSATVVDRDINTTTYRRPDGIQTTRIYTEARNFRDADGNWKPIDSSVVARSEGGHENAAGPTRFTFAEDTKSEKPVGVEGEGWSLSFGLEGAAPGRPSDVSGTKVTYGGILDGTDLSYEVDGNSLKEIIILRQAPSPERQGRYRFAMALSGASAIADQGGVSLVNDMDAVVARISDGLMWDSNEGQAGPAEHPVDVLLAEGNVVEVVADPAWLASPERVYPIYIDPTVQIGISQDTHVRSSSPNTNYSGQTNADIGYQALGNEMNHAFMRFDMSSLAGEEILSAHWNGYFTNTNALYPTDYFLRPVAANWNVATITWSNQPGGIANESIVDKASEDEWRRVDITDWARNWVDSTWPNYGIRFDTDGQQSSALFKEVSTSESSNDPFVEVSYGSPGTEHAPPAPTALSPAEDATVFTQTPRLEVSPVTDPDGDTVQYWFRVATGFEGAAPGQILDSGWIGSTSWTVPKYTLEDGVKYAWTAYAWDGQVSSKASWWNPLTVDLRLGVDSSPRDTLGPVTVDLATGNGSVGVASPSFATVGGSIGLSFNYNSLGPYLRGLRGEYFEDANSNRLFDDTSEQAFRLDTQVSFEWQNDTPYPFVPADNFLARWTGNVTVPNGGSWSFGAASDDGVRIWVNNTLVLDRWFNQALGAPNYGTAISLSAGQRVPIKVEYYEATGNAGISVAVRGPGVSNDTVVPSDWLTPPHNRELPDGWEVNTGGSAAAYRSARVNDHSVTLIGPWGDTHEYKRNSTGFTPPPGGDGVLAADAATGNLILHDSDGFVYAFRADGSLDSATSPIDDANPASPVYVWSGSPLRVTAVRDPVSGREMGLAYGGGDCPAPPAGGFDAAPPAGMLCRAVYWDGTQTHLFYAAGQLARIQDPGGEVTDFAYSTGRLSKIQGALAADAVAAGKRAADDSVVTRLLYDAEGRVRFVELPSPTLSAARASHSYTFGSSTTTVSGADDTGPSTYSFDARGRVTEINDPLSLRTRFEWNDDDSLLATTDPFGRKTTTIYDDEGVPTDSYGPSYASWFGADRRPLASKVTQVAHTQTRYDEGMSSLAASYWPNLNLAGPPKCHDTGVGHASGALSKNWGLAGPACLSPTVDNWSARYTGEIVLPESGTYTFRVYADGGARLWIDDLPIVDSWSDSTGFKPDGLVDNTEPNSRHRIRLDYAETTLNAGLELHWISPSGSTGLVPGSNLSPRYRLVTGETTNDSQAGILTTSTSYASPHSGLPSASIQDPAGLALTTNIGYESGGFRRPVSRSLPAGNTWTYEHYAATETLTAATCGLAIGALQAGFVKKRTGPDPDGLGTGVSRVEQFVYDAAGRPKGVKVATSGWSCSTYDARGRVVTETHPAHGGNAARTVTSNYAVGGDPLRLSVSDAVGTITKTIDLLGRVLTYTDKWGMTTNYSYDRAGRVTAMSGTVGNQTFAYDSAGRLVEQKLEGQVLAQLEYPAGELKTVWFRDQANGQIGAGNNTSVVLTRDSSGALVEVLVRDVLEATIASDTVTRSQSGRVIDESIDGVDPRPGLPNFTYDAAGRLTAGYVSGRTVSYGYQGSGGCGLLATAGKNSNRTSMSTNGSDPKTYCYDHADRLTSTTDTPYSAPAYDARGNTTKIGTERPSYDGADRHVKTVKGTTTIQYVRDATDRIVERKIGLTTTRYGYAADGDSPDFTMNGAGIV